ncbi:MAG: toxic anion resistance protein [Deltaproteobacteria bacterium]|nr:toxic anion resistance protein [Deltaproteobacteria bacterium]
MIATQTQEAHALIVADQAGIQQELGLVAPGTISLEGKPDPKLDQQAGNFVKSILAFNPEDPAQMDFRDRTIAAVEQLGSKTRQEASHRSAMLKEPIRKLASRGEDGGEVANALVDLKSQVEELDPGGLDFKAGWFTRTLGMLPGIGTPLKKYFSRFETAQTVIDAIIRALDEGRNVLNKDNVTLAQDQKAMRMLTFKLGQVIQLGMIIDQKISYALDREIGPDDPKRRFVEDEILFPLRQRIQDLQQQLAVNQQGVLAIEIIIRNNKELIKGVDRGINVTVNALNVAVTVALALANQKIVLDKINAVTQVTNQLIGQTAAQLRSQGVEIQKRASSTQIDIETLKKAFADINGALDDISEFRKQALPQMANNILEMDELTKTTEEAIQRMEQGNQAAPAVMLDVEL